MAEIKIKEKKPIWPWILVVLGILVLLYFIFFTGDDKVADDMDDNVEMIGDDDMKNDDAVMLSEAATSKVSDYKTYIADDAKMGIDHNYSNGALIRLIDATEAVANTLDVDIRADLDMARANAASIMKDPNELDHADKIKNSGNIIVKALKTIQTQKFPDMFQSCTELQNSLMAIAPGTQTLEQKAAIKNFFQQAGELLTKMKNK